MAENTRGHNASGQRGGEKKRNAANSHQRNNLDNDRQVLRSREGSVRETASSNSNRGATRAIAFKRNFFSTDYDGQLSDE